MASRFSLALRSTHRTAQAAARIDADDRAPSKRLLLREAAVLANITSGTASINRLARAHAADCDARPIVLLPGFMAAPISMAVLHTVLKRAGYRVYDWGQGRNFGARVDTLDRITQRVAAVAQMHKRPVTLIGWSLGGVYAREAAKQNPQQVRSVMTLGSPFSGDARANNAWRLYERIAGHSVYAPPIAVNTRQKPPVPTTALWSRRDGVIAVNSARGQADERDQAIECDCAHLGFASQPGAIQTILDVLAQESGR